jgi:hypothetical protein
LVVSTVEYIRFILIYKHTNNTNINIFHLVVAILSTVLRVSHSAKPLG